VEQTDLTSRKSALRCQMRMRMKAFCADVQGRQKASSCAVRAFLSSEVYKNAETVLLFVPLPDEVDTSYIIEKALADGKRTAVPRTEGNGLMDFYYLDGEKPVSKQLSAGSYGILEPEKTAEKIDTLQFPPCAVIAVPGLAFSKDGNRLGRGKGYYDAYVRRIETSGGSQPSALAAVCFGFQVLESVPHGSFDLHLTHIADDSGFTVCR
jgi:5-formyltetrahydrofolate cyclo-ligase